MHTDVSTPVLRRAVATTSPVTSQRKSPAKPLLADFQAQAGEAASLLKALAHPDRLRLLCHLVGTERSVTELGVLAQIEQPSLSQQLGVLRGERVVETRREGKRVIYRVGSPAALALLETLHGLFCADATPGAGRGVPSTGARVKRARLQKEMR